ncbi:MAG: phage major capsid protein [Veillonellales bacterium]
MNLKELLKQKLDRQAELVGVAVQENRGMSAEEQAEFDTLEGEIKSLETTIQSQEKVAQRAAELNTPVNSAVVPAVAGSSVEVKEKKWKSFGEMLQSVRKAAIPAAEGGRIDNRLLDGIRGAATGSNETISSEGGFLVDEQYVTDLLTKTYDSAVVAGKTWDIPIGANANRLRMNGIDEKSRANGSRYGGVQAYWSGEAQTVTATKPKFRKIELELDKLFALCYATDELLEDSTALEAVITKAFQDEMAFKLDDAIINGSGAGVPLGILNCPALVTVAKESNQTAGTIAHENILKMYNRVWARSRMNAAWFINQECEPQLENMTVTIGTAGEISPYAKEYADKGTIKGKPVYTIEQCSGLGAVGDIILADMSQYIMIHKGGITPATSVHVRFLYDEQVFRFTYRVNGMPGWNAPLSPYKGTTTLSPFVALATRA